MCAQKPAVPRIPAARYARDNINLRPRVVLRPATRQRPAAYRRTVAVGGTGKGRENEEAALPAAENSARF